MAETGYFLTADLLGFGRIVQNSNDAELDERIDHWVSLVSQTAADTGVARYQLISDTLFAATPSSHDGLAQLLKFGQLLLEHGIRQSFPLRGAVAHGAFNWGTLTYGRAVIASHKLEQAQNWIGISCEPGLPHVGALWSVDRLVCYPPPLKHAAMKLHPVVAWQVPGVKSLLTQLMSGQLTHKGEVVSWDLGEKANNTVLFSLYLQLLRDHGGDAAKYNGLLPVHAIAAELGADA